MIDWNRVRELRDEIGAEDFGEVVLMFLQEADEVVLRMRGGDPPRVDAPGSGRLSSAASAAARSSASVVEDLHFLRGAALNLGFRELAELCHDGERRAKVGQPVDLTVVADHFTAVRAIFIAGLERDQAG